MKGPIDSAELELVRKAIALGRSVVGCCEWHKSAIDRIGRRPPHSTMTVATIRQQLCDFVASHPEAVIQVAERRDEYLDRKFYYKVILPVAEIKNGLFVELILDDDDPNYPVVLIVNSHEQRR